jgi:membrane protein
VRRFLRQIRAVFGDAIGHLNEDDGWAMASHVALSALMAVFPFLIFVAALAGFIGNADLAGRVADLLFATWPKEVAVPIAAEVHRVLTEAHVGLVTVSALVTIFLSSNGVEAVRSALNRAYRASEHRSFFVRRAQSVVFVLLGAVASLALAFLGVLGPLIVTQLTQYLPALQPFAGQFTFAGFAVTGFFLTIVLIAAHLWLPAARPDALRLWPGIVGTLLLWMLMTTIFAIYVQRFAQYVATYAGLAGVVTAIFFLYLIALIMICGAEFNAALGRLRDGKTG